MAHPRAATHLGPFPKPDPRLFSTLVLASYHTIPSPERKQDLLYDLTTRKGFWVLCSPPRTDSIPTREARLDYDFCGDFL